MRGVLYKIVFSIFFAMQLQAKVIIISDLDDTFVRSNIRGNYYNRIKAYSEIEDAFYLMPKLYRNLINSGVEIHFISSTPWFLEAFTSLATQTLNLYQVPASLQTRVNILKGSYDYKTSAIINFMQNSSPDDVFILIGDNGQADPDVFEAIHRHPQVGNRILASYVRYLYSENLELRTSNYEYFLTSGDLALKLASKGVLREQMAASIAHSVALALEDTVRSVYTEVIPEWAEISHRPIEFVFSKIPEFKNPEDSIAGWNHLKYSLLDSTPPFLCKEIF